MFTLPLELLVQGGSHKSDGRMKQTEADLVGGPSAPNPTVLAQPDCQLSYKPIHSRLAYGTWGWFFSHLQFEEL